MERNRSSFWETGSTSHGSSGAEFDVFLSFRGPDTRANFTDSLYHALLDKGIQVFIDKKGIDVGVEIGPEIFQAIDDSKICIPIFSRGYASSKWCLRELEHMMERRKTNDLEVLPIFYDVEPSDVMLETEVYKDALTLHEEKHGPEIVQPWAEALKEVARVKGWDTKNQGHGELARLIAQKVLVKLKVSYVHISDNLVGMDESVDEVVDLLNVESEDRRLIGICGMGGIGKTTLAKVVYHKLFTNFISCSFISNIREASKSLGLSNLQRQLVFDILGNVGVELSSVDHGINMIKDRFKIKKVLIVLDDVDHRSQLMALAAKTEWLGSGSRIVVTTRDKSVLSGFQDQLEHCLIYEAKGLKDLEALKLFSKHAFRSNSPPNAFLSLSKKVTSKIGGLPLAIEVMGSLLYGKKKAVWEDILKKMEHYPHKDVKEKLMLSYEVLDYQQRQIFLDIACFLAGEKKSYADYMWYDCGFYPNEGIEALLLMSLVKIGEDNQLWMHDQLKDLGKSIVYQENFKDSGQCSRVWNHEEALDMIKRKKGTEIVVATSMNFGRSRPATVLTSDEFMKVPSIRFLEMAGGNLSGDFEDLFSELRWLSWKNGPSMLSATNFCPKNLLILDLSSSRIDELWGGWTQLKVATRLKVLNLSKCPRLKKTPDLSAYFSLEILILEECRNLLRIDRSIGHLRRLKHLNLNSCTRLQVLPVELGSLKALTELLIRNYNFFGSISQVPRSIGALIKLECLAICGVPELTTLPDSIGMLQSLAELDISSTSIRELPNIIVNLKSLKVLKMNRSRMQKLPEAMGMLKKLEEIYGENCLWLEMIPGDIGRLPFLKILKLTQTRVQNVPQLPQSLPWTASL
ncbi:disease resistance protein L6-like isoform X2 [Syzygium oleosum]|uniref:disease resistance protein L6-like isoform X2 n=1 Tax=Syzygium oleosum TaxID=219896 RepID=UPI0024BA16DD|nr:disease resistance protein L6-like isoform X2 [Syzygium oleosum]